MQNLDTLQVLLACDRNSNRETLKRPALDALLKIRDRRVWHVIDKEITTNVIGTPEWTQVRPLRMLPSVVALMMADKKSIFIFDGRNGIIYNTENDDWVAIQDSPTHRADFAAVALADGSIFICGGTSEDVEEDTEQTAQVYRDGSWHRILRQMERPRENHACTALKDGRVLITGGSAFGAFRRGMVTEIYDPRTGQFLDFADAQWSPLRMHASITLPNGKVLVCGGLSNTRRGAINDSALFSVKTNSWIGAASMNVARYLHQLVSFEGGRIIIAIGGWEGDHHNMKAEMYDFENDTWTLAPEYDLQDESVYSTDSLDYSNLIFADAD